MNEQARDRDVIIVGGGLIGLSLGLAMARTGVSSRIVDKCPQVIARSDAGKGQVYIITPPTRALFDRIGIWQDVRPRAHDLFEIHVGGNDPSPRKDFALHFGRHDRRGSPIAHIVEGRHLNRALLAAMDRDDAIDMLHGVGLRARHDRRDHVDVVLDNGRTLSAQLLLGADGRMSQTAAVSGISHRVRDFDHAAMVTTLSHDPIKLGAAYQLLRRDGPLSVLPLTTRCSSVMWTVPTHRAQALIDMDDRAFVAEMRAHMPSFLGQVALAGKRVGYPLRASIARRFTAPRTALAGDAAHVFHPVTGQGLNFGARDITKLTQLVFEARRAGRDIGAQTILRAYERARKRDAVLMALATNGIISMSCSSNPLLAIAQRSGISALGAMPRIRDSLIRHAQGRKTFLPIPPEDELS